MLCRFKSEWLNQKAFKSWIGTVQDDTMKARCIVCRKNFDISTMGTSAVQSHMRGSKHQSQIIHSNLKMTQFVKKSTGCASTSQSVTVNEP